MKWEFNMYMEKKKSTVKGMEMAMDMGTVTVYQNQPPK
jgi:hypothetical protein